MRTSYFVPILAIAAGCSSPVGLDVDLSRFDAIPAIDSLNAARIQPAASWDYWELRFRFEGGMPDQIVTSGGPVARTQLPSIVTTQLEALAPPAGFAAGCLPAYCFKFIAAVEQQQVTTFLDPDALRVFLGNLETVEEAALLVNALNFYWPSGRDATGYRTLPGIGWEFVVLQLARDCMPVQTDRFLLRVEHSGSVAVRGREIWQKHDEACI